MFDVHFSLPRGNHNVRDLGGLPRADGTTTALGRVLRACAMQHIGTEGREALVSAGLRTVIDLRSDAERAAAPSPFRDTVGVATQCHPVFADLAPISQMIGSEPDFRMQDRYIRALELAAPRFAAVIRAIAEAEPGMVIFHCTAGKDRTGIVAAMLLDLAGVSREAIVADYARTADHGAALIETLRRKALAAGQSPEAIEKTLVCPPEAIGTTLETLDRNHGGVRAYLKSAGLDDDLLHQVTARLEP